MRPILLLLVALAPAWAGYKATIHRDTFGVPHIYGRSDADVVFGLAFSMAEDNFWQLEEDYIRQLGRAAQVHGRDGLEGDMRFRLFEVEKRSRAAYASGPAAMRAVANAFAAGYNHYLAMHPAVKPRLIGRLEGWEVMAFQDGSPSLTGAGVAREDVSREFPLLAGRRDAATPPGADEGSNMWAISPRKSASGKAMLFLNPHVGFFGGGQRYEAHLESRQGLSVSGFAILGTPYIRSGFTARHGWCHTNNNADIVDVWKEPASPEGLAQWTERIPVAGGATVDVRMRKTAHGAVVGLRDGRMLAKRGPAIVVTDLMTQRIAMAKARSLAEFQAALRRRAMTGSNTMYADARGNIWYVHGNAIPRRDPALDWTQPVDGALPNSAWQGLHDFDDLPRFLNPASGYLQNCNSTPAHAAGEVAEAKAYPKYFLPELDNFRAKRSREILNGLDRFTFEAWAKAALDTGVYLARREKEALAAAWPAFRERFPERAEKVRPAVETLAAWDGVSRNDSVGMALFMAAFPLAHGPVGHGARPRAGGRGARRTRTRKGPRNVARGLGRDQPPAAHTHFRPPGAVFGCAPEPARAGRPGDGGDRVQLLRLATGWAEEAIWADGEFVHCGGGVREEDTGRVAAGVRAERRSTIAALPGPGPAVLRTALQDRPLLSRRGAAERAPHRNDRDEVGGNLHLIRQLRHALPVALW